MVRCSKLLLCNEVQIHECGVVRRSKLDSAKFEYKLGNKAALLLTALLAAAAAAVTAAVSAAVTVAVAVGAIDDAVRTGSVSAAGGGAGEAWCYCW